MKKIIIIALTILTFISYAQVCKHCHGYGTIETVIQCPLCLGYGNLSPAWFNLEVGNTRWTETTYWTGFQTKSDVRKKMFSFKACPYCVKSKRIGSIVWTHLCSCPAGESKKIKSICASARAKVKSKCKNLDVDMTGLDTGNDEFALNVDRWMSRWQLPPKLFRKLLNEVINNKFDTESAHYKRDESKYTEKKFKDSEDSDIPVGARKYDSDEKKDENSNESENSNEITSMNSSYIAPKMFMASMPKMKPVEYVCKCEISDSYYGVFRRSLETHWAVRIEAYNKDESDYETLYGYVSKASLLGKKISSILSDGKTHKLTLVMRYKAAEHFSSAVEIIGIK